MASASFFEKKEAKKFCPLGLGVAATGEAHKTLSVHRKVGGWAPPGIAGSEPKSGSPFCFFFLQEKEDPS
jgi:hypothetical protein